MLISSWLKAVRLRTLPLAVSNTIVGSALALMEHQFRCSIFIMATITAVLLQILSNLANDYGDFKNGMDTQERVGPRRMVQSGEISPHAMLNGIKFIVCLSIVCGVFLIALVVNELNWYTSLFFLLLGVGAILAAILYTNGKNPFGYRGYGDLFVFVFFGCVGVVGTYFLHTSRLESIVFLPAISIGLLSVGVLNVNNMRDVENDRNLGKRTLVVKLGRRGAKVYHLFLVVGAILCMLLFSVLTTSSIYQLLYLVSFPLLFVHLRNVLLHKHGISLIDELGRLSVATLLLAIAFFVGILLA
ncbi:MAG TPA: 1,4-dihydroxy-2-naphthoate polyprenyltransferase [Flavobacterium sp.]|nr:1,4-dihydroxy-2-naphthoate polyprenyltransferase [Flavobacterium sp.]